MSGKKRDFTLFYIVAFVAVMAGSILFTIALEVMKFMALLKWLAS